MADLSHLSPRELEVLQMISAGRNTKEIARQLSTSVGTVKNQTYTMFKKIGVRNRVEAALLFHGVETAHG